MNLRLAACYGASLAALVLAGCSAAPHSGTAADGAPQSFAEVEIREHACIDRLQDGLGALQTSRMDVFFSAALNGLVDCEAGSGLAHAPTAEVTRWLSRANGRPAPVAIPKPPPALAKVPRADEDRLAYQHACVAYMRRYLPASIARAGDDPDVAAAFTFNALEECDADAGFADIEPHTLAAIMQKKHLL